MQVKTPERWPRYWYPYECSGGEVESNRKDTADVSYPFFSSLNFAINVHAAVKTKQHPQGAQ